MDLDTRKAHFKWSIAGESRSRQSNLLALAANNALLADPGDRWDLDPMLLGVPNGVVDLHTGLLRPGSPEDRITVDFLAPYDPDATCPLWDRVMEEVFAGDQDLISYMDRAFGYSLTRGLLSMPTVLPWSRSQRQGHPR